MEKSALVALEDMVSLMRIQKHDILNHLQVVSGFMQLKKPDLAQMYLQKAIAEINSYGMVLKVQSPELVGVLYHYREKSAGLGIPFEIQLVGEMIELGNGVELARSLKEIFEYLLGPVYQKLARVQVFFLEHENGEKLCRVGINWQEAGTVNEINSIIISAGAAFYEENKNISTIEFKIY